MARDAHVLVPMLGGCVMLFCIIMIRRVPQLNSVIEYHGTSVSEHCRISRSNYYSSDKLNFLLAWLIF